MRILILPFPTNAHNQVYCVPRNSGSHLTCIISCNTSNKPMWEVQIIFPVRSRKKVQKVLVIYVADKWCRLDLMQCRCDFRASVPNHYLKLIKWIFSAILLLFKGLKPWKHLTKFSKSQGTQVGIAMVFMSLCSVGSLMFTVYLCLVFFFFSLLALYCMLPS